jgi:hypothetical protein
MSWEDFKQKKKDSEAMEAQAEMAMRECLAVLLDRDAAAAVGHILCLQQVRMPATFHLSCSNELALLAC